MTKAKRRIAADVCSFIGDEDGHLHLEMMLPGVKKEAVTLRMRDDSFFLSASGESMEYVTTSAFCCPVDSGKATAEFMEGLLKIVVPFKDPMEGTIDIPVQ